LNNEVGTLIMGFPVSMMPIVLSVYEYDSRGKAPYTTLYMSKAHHFVVLDAKDENCRFEIAKFSPK